MFAEASQYRLEECFLIWRAYARALRQVGWVDVPDSPFASPRRTTQDRELVTSVVQLWESSDDRLQAQWDRYDDRE